MGKPDLKEHRLYLDQIIKEGSVQDRQRNEFYYDASEFDNFVNFMLRRQGNEAKEILDAIKEQDVSKLKRINNKLRLFEVSDLENLKRFAENAVLATLLMSNVISSAIQEIEEQDNILPNNIIANRV